jgi:hypothetical protein
MTTAPFTFLFCGFLVAFGVVNADPAPGPEAQGPPLAVMQGYGVDGVVLWLAADSGAMIDSHGRVVALKDKTGNFTLTTPQPAQAPTFIAHGLNGKPVLRFDGNQSLFSGDNFGSALDRDMTIILVSKTTANSDSEEFPLYLGGNAVAHANRAFCYFQGKETFDGQFVCCVGQPVIKNVFSMEGASIDPTLSKATFYRNGAQTVVGGITLGEGEWKFGNVSDGVTMGAATGPFCGWQGDIAEELVFDHQLSASEMQVLWSRLAQKYGLSSTVR